MLKHYHLCHTTNTACLWELHKADCSDVYKMFRGVGKIKLASKPVRIEAETPQDAVSVLAAEVVDLGYSESDYRIMPCCSDAPSKLDMSLRVRFK